MPVGFSTTTTSSSRCTTRTSSAFGARRRPRLEHLHHLALLQPPGHVGADVAVDHHVPRPHQLLHAAPAGIVELRPEKRRERLPLLGGASRDGPLPAGVSWSTDDYHGRTALTTLDRFFRVLDFVGRPHAAASARRSPFSRVVRTSGPCPAPASSVCSGATRPRASSSTS